MAKRKRKNRMVIESLEQRLLLTANPWNDDAASKYDSTDLTTMSGHYKLENVTEVDSLSRVLTVEMKNANGTPGTVGGWDLICVNSLDITAKQTDSYSPNVATTNNISDLTHNDSGRYVIRLKSLGTLGADKFDPLKSYRWEILESKNAINVNGSKSNKFDPSVFVVDTADFFISGDYSNKKTIDNNTSDDGGIGIVYGGRFAVELDQNRLALYVNYISPIKPIKIPLEVSYQPSTISVGANKELLWNINDVGESRSETYNSAFTNEYEQFGHDGYDKIDFSNKNNLNSASPFTIRVRTLASSKNALSLFGAGSFGAIHNFDITKSYEWKIADSVTGLSSVLPNQDLQLLIAQNKVVLDTSNFIGAGMNPNAKDLSLSVNNDGALVLKYTPQVVETPTSNFKTSESIVCTTKTGDVSEINLSDYFDPTFTTIAVIRENGLAGSGNTFTKNEEFKLFFENRTMYFIPYITNSIATSIQQETDRGFSGLSKFKIRASNKDGLSVTKEFNFYVSSGYSRLYLKSSVGEGATNDTSDLLKVKQRLKYFGIPANTQAFGTINSSALNKNLHALSNFSSIEVNNKKPGNFSVDTDFYKALGLFSAMVKNIPNMISDGTSKSTYSIHTFGGNYKNGVAKKIDPSSNNDLIYQWLSASNAPFWMELVDSSLAITNENDGKGRGDFSISNMSQSYGGPDNIQSERYGSSWLVDVVYSIGKERDGKFQINGLSLINGGDTSFHKNHESGLSIDIGTKDEYEATNEKKTDLLNVLGGYGLNVLHNLNTNKFVKDSAYGSKVGKDPGSNHYHMDIRTPLLEEVFFKLEKNVFYNLKGLQSRADSYKLYAVNGVVLTDAQRSILGTTKSLTINNVTIRINTQEDLKKNGRFYVSSFSSTTNQLELTFEVVDNDALIGATNAKANNFTYQTTISLNKNTNVPCFIDKAVGSVGTGGNNNSVDIALTKARLNYLGYKDDANNELDLVSTNQNSLVQAIKRFQRAVRTETNEANINGKIVTASKASARLWNVNAPRVTENGTTNYVEAFAEKSSQTGFSINYAAAEIADVNLCNADLVKAINDMRAFGVEVASGTTISNAINTYLAADNNNNNVGKLVDIRKIYVNSSENTTSINNKGKIVKSEGVASGTFAVELIISNLGVTPSAKVDSGLTSSVENAERYLPSFNNTQETPSLASLDNSNVGWETNFLNSQSGSLRSFSSQTMSNLPPVESLEGDLSPWQNSNFISQSSSLRGFSVDEETESSGESSFSIANIFDFTSPLKAYIETAKEDGGISYEGMTAALNEKMDSVLDIFDDRSINSKVYFDEDTQELICNISFEVSKEVSSGFDFGVLSDAFSGARLPVNFEVGFIADYSFGIKFSKFLNDEVESVSLEDMYLRVDTLRLYANASYGDENEQDRVDPETQNGEFVLGSIGLKATLNELSLDISTDWFVEQTETHSRTVSFDDIANGKVKWDNKNVADFSGELLLSAQDENISGNAVLKLQDENLFESGGFEFTINGEIEVEEFTVGDNLLKLGKTKLKFDSAAHRVDIESDSAHLNIGNDILVMNFDDSATDEDTVAIKGFYNYEDGDFKLDIDKWEFKIKGVVEAQGEDLVFGWNDTLEELGQEIIEFERLENLKIIPLNKTVNFEGVDTQINGETVKRALSIRDNGFMLSKISSFDLTEDINIGNGTLTVKKPQLTFENIVYSSDDGLTGRIIINSTSAQAEIADAIKLEITDGSDSDTWAISGSYDVASKRFQLKTDSTSLDIAKGRITSVINGLNVSCFFDDDGTSNNEEILYADGDINLTLKLTDEITKTIDVKAQQMSVNGEEKRRSISITGNAFMLGDASVEITETQKIGPFEIVSPKIVLQNFGYNKETGEYTGKFGLSAESCNFKSSNSIVTLAISKITGDAIELFYDLSNDIITGNIDRIDFAVKRTNGKELFTVSTIGSLFTIDGDNTSIEMSNVNTIFPDLPIPSQTLGKIKIEDETVVVTHLGKNYDLSKEQDVTDLLKALGEGLIGGDDDVVLTQDAVTKKIFMKDRSSGEERESWDLASLGEDGLMIDLGKGVDTIKIDSDIDMGGKDLSINSEFITISNKKLTNVDDLKLSANSELDITALDLIGLLLEAFNVDLNGSATTVDINFDSLVNRLLGRAEAVITINNSNVSANTVSFTSNVTVTGESKGIIPADFSDSDDEDAKKFKIDGLTTAIASVQAKALVNILNSVITSGKDLKLTSTATVNAKSTAVAEAQSEDGEESGEDDTSYEAVVSLVIANVKAVASIGGTSKLNITGNISIEAANKTELTSTANGIPADESKKAYGGSIGILSLQKDTEASIGSEVEFTKNPASVSVVAESETKVVNQVIATAGGAKSNKSSNKETVNKNGGKTSNGNINVAGAAAVTIVNESTSATANFKTLNKTSGDFTVRADGKTDITTSADGSTVGNADSDSKVGVGVAVALNVVDAGVQASASNVSAKNILIGASNSATKVSAEAKSGAGAKNVGIAGSVAVNTIDQTTVALGSSKLELGGGELSVKSTQSLNAASKAEPKKDVSAGKVGIGASFALNDIITETKASDSGSNITGSLSGLTIEATSSITTNAETKAGSTASGNNGVSISPSVAINTVQANTSANHLSTGSFEVSGDISVTSKSTIDSDIKAGASADGSVAVGASVGVAVIDAKNTAEAASSLKSKNGKIAIFAENKIDSFVNVEATPRKSEGSKKSDDEANKELLLTRLSSNKKQSSNSDTVIKNQNSEANAEGGTNSNTASVAAAIGVNVITSNNSANVINEAALDALGKVSVIASEDVDVVTQAVGLSYNIESDNSGANIGAGAGLNIVNKANSVNVVAGQIHSESEVEIKADSIDTNKSAILAVAAAAGMGDGFSIAATTGVNVINSNTFVNVDKSTSIQVDNGQVVIEAENRTDIQTLVLAAGLSENSGGIGAAVAVNVANLDASSKFAGSVDGHCGLDVTAINNVSSEGHKFKVTNPTDVDVEMSGMTAVAAAGGASSGSVGIAGSFIINDINQDTIVTVDAGKGINIYDTVKVFAEAKTEISNVAGSIGVSGGSAGVGAASDVTIINKTTNALVENSGIDSKRHEISAGSMEITADSDESVLSVVAGLSASESVAVGVTSSVLVVDTNTEASVMMPEQLVERKLDGTNISLRENLEIRALGDIDVTQVVTGVAASGGASVGGGAAVFDHDDNTIAYTGYGTSVYAEGFVTVEALSSEKVVQVAANVDAGSVAVNGTAIVATYNENTNAYIGADNDIQAAGVTVNVGAETGHISVTGSVAAGTAGVGLGGSVVTINKNTNASIVSGSEAFIEAHGGDVGVTANSDERIISITAGVAAGTAGVGLNSSVNVFNVKTDAIIGNYARVVASGNVVVSAHENMDIDQVAAGVAAGVAGVGMAAAVTTINQDTNAGIGDGANVTALGEGSSTSVDYGKLGTLDTTASKSATDSNTVKPLSVNKFKDIKTRIDFDEMAKDADVAPISADKGLGSASAGDHDEAVAGVSVKDTESSVRGVAVMASGNTDITMIAAGIGAGAVGVSLNAGVAVIESNVNAAIGDNALINKEDSGLASNLQSVNIAAGNNLNYTAVAGSLAAGVVGVAPAANVVIAKLTTNASVDSNAQVFAKDGGVKIASESCERLLGVAFGGAGGLVGIGGSAQVIRIENNTGAQIYNSALVQTTGDLTITAIDNTKLTSFSGGIAGGLVGIGATVGVLTICKDTSVMVDGNVKAKNVNVDAFTNDYLFQLAVAGAGGFVGVGGTVSVLAYDAETNVQIGVSATIDASGSIKINSHSVSNVRTFTLGISGGFVGIGGAVSVGSINNGTHTNVNGKLYSESNVDVKAISDVDLNAQTISGTGGAVAVNAGVSTWSIGGKASTVYDGKDALNDPDYPNVERPDDRAGSVSGDSLTQTVGLLNKRQNSAANIAPKSSNNSGRNDIGGATSKVSSAGNFGTSSNLSPGTSVYVGNVIQAANDVNIEATGNVVVNQDTPVITGGAIAVGGSVNILDVDNDVSTLVGGKVIAGNINSIKSNVTEDISIDTKGGQAGLITVGAAVIVASEDSSANTIILETGSNASRTEILGKNVTISSTKDIKSFDAKISKPNAGAIVLGASFIDIDASGNAGTILNTGSKVEAFEDLVIKADVNEKVKSNIVPLNVGVFTGVGSISNIDVENNAVVVINASEITAYNVQIKANGNHNDKAKIDSFSAGAVNADVIQSKIANTSDARVNISAADILGSTVQINTSNNFDRESYELSTWPQYKTISGDSFSAASGQVDKSTVSLGSSNNKFSSEITIGGNAKIKAVKTEQNTGLPKIEMLAQSTVFLNNEANVEAVSIFGNRVSVESNLDAFLESKITISNAEIQNTSGTVSFSTLSKGFIENKAKADAGSLLMSTSIAKADSNVAVDNSISLENAKIIANEISVSSGKVLNNSQELSGEGTIINSGITGHAYATSLVGCPNTDVKHDFSVVNLVAITGNSNLKSFGCITIDSESSKLSLKRKYEQDGYLIGGDQEELVEFVSDTSKIVIGANAKISAGSENDQTVIVLDKKHIDNIGLTVTGNNNLTAEQITAINSLGHGIINHNTEMVAERLAGCEIEIPLYVGSVIKDVVTGKYYKYKGINLKLQDYNNGSLWELQDEEFFSADFYDAEIIGSKMVALDYGDYVRYNGKFYKNLKFRTNFTQENWGSGEWDTNVSEKEKEDAIDSNINELMTKAIEENFVVIKPKDMPTPRLSYVDYVNYLKKQIAEIQSEWSPAHYGTSGIGALALARYDATVQMLEAELAQLPQYEFTGFDENGNPFTQSFVATHALILTFDDIQASSGTVIIATGDNNGNVDTQSQNDIEKAVEEKRLTAGCGSSVSINNVTPMSVAVNDITMKANDMLAVDNNNSIVSLNGGRVYLNLVDISPSSDVLDTTVEIIQDAVGENDLVFQGEKLVFINNVFVNGTILNENGKVTITNRAGSVNIGGEIIALEQEISSKTSVNINTPGFYIIGSNPNLLIDGSLRESLKGSGTITSAVPFSQNGARGKNENERYDRSGGIVRALGNITIIAGHINVNGTIESGISNLEVDIHDVTIIESILNPFLRNPLILNPFIRRTVTRSTTSTVVDANVNGNSVSAKNYLNYNVDNVNKVVEIDDIVTGSGNIILCGDLFNSNPEGGNIKIAHGYANITIKNNSDYKLIVNDIDTSRENKGSITLYDTKRYKEATGKDGTKIIYKYDKSQNQISKNACNVVFEDNLYKYVKDDTTSGTISGSKTTYKPTEGLFLNWVEGFATGTTTVAVYQKKTRSVLPGWEVDWLAKDPKNRISESTKVISQLELVKSLGLYLFEPGSAEYTMLNNAGVYTNGYEYFGRYSSETTPGYTNTTKSTSGGGWLKKKTYTTIVTTNKVTKNLFSHYLYASNNIGIDFSGGNSESRILIESKGDVVLQGNLITPDNSTTEIISDGNVNIADNAIFSGTVPIIKSNNDGDTTLNVVISDEPVNITANGNITINAISKDGSSDSLIIGKIISTGGNVTINSETGVVANDNTSLIKGEKVYINAANGSIGNFFNGIKVDSNILGEGGLAANASNNIFITEVEGDLKLIDTLSTWTNTTSSINSASGGVYITTVDGSIKSGLTDESKVTSHVSGSNVLLHTGAETNSVSDIIIGKNDDLYIYSASDINIKSVNDLNIANIDSEGAITISANGNIVDTGRTSSAIACIGGLTLNSTGSINGLSLQNPFNVCLNKGSELVVNASNNSWINQVAYTEALASKTEIVSDGLIVKSANSSGSICVSTEIGNLEIEKVTANGDIKLASSNDILDLNTVDVNAETKIGNIYLDAGGAIGSHDNFFDVVATKGSLTSQSKKDTFIDSKKSLTVKSAVSNEKDIVVRVTGNASVANMNASVGTVVVDSSGSIFNGRKDNADVISAATIVLNAESGTIGTESKKFAVDSSSGTVTAEALKEVFLTENSGIMNINSVKSVSSEVVISSKDGMADANTTFDLGLENFELSNFHVGALVDDLNVAGTTIKLDSSAGIIGTNGNIEVDVYGDRTGRIHADAQNCVYIEEIIGSMNVGTISSSDGCVRIGTRDTVNTGEDIYLDSSSQVKALNSYVEINSGDDIYDLGGSVIKSGSVIDLVGDFGNADLGVGTNIVINGSMQTSMVAIYGNKDNDTVNINVGNGNVIDGSVSVYSHDGDDIITCVKLDTEQIHLYSGNGNDTVVASQMNNRVHIYGEDGEDLITGGKAGDIIFGGGGDDIINAGDGTDIVFGDSGYVQDSYIGALYSSENVGNDTIDAGDGADIVLGDKGTIVTKDLYLYENVFDTLISVGSVFGGADDSIAGGKGEDLIMGGSGNDHIDGGENSDIIFGDVGTVTYVVKNGKNHIEKIDNMEETTGDDDTIIGGTGEEIILGGAGEDTIDTGVDNGSDIILGDVGRIEFEVVESRAVVKTINTEEHISGMADQIYSGAGKDIVFGGSGADTIDTSDGINSIVIGDGGVVTFDNPDLDNHNLSSVKASTYSYGDNDNIVTGDSADIIMGGFASDNINSGAGEDIIIGDNGVVNFENGIISRIESTNGFIEGNDTITAGNDNKIILGSGGNDTITSQDGDDIIIGDGGYVKYDNGVIVEASSGGADYGNDSIDAGIGRNTVFGGLGDDVIKTGIKNAATDDLRDNFSNDNDVVIGDNGRRTFNETGVQVGNHDFATLSFNFVGNAQKGIGETEVVGAPLVEATNWMNILSDGPGTYGNDPSEIIRTNYGERLTGLNLSWGGKENHRIDSVELHNYQMENYNPTQVSDGNLFAGGIRTSAPNSQLENRLEVEMDGLNKYFKEYSVIVYIDAPRSVSSLIQNASDSVLGSKYGKGESIRKVNINSANVNDSFFIDDAADSSNPNYNTFNGNYIRAVAKNAIDAFGEYANYVVFNGLTDDRFVVTITDGVVNINYNGLDIPSIAGIQIVGKFHPVDNIETLGDSDGGNDEIMTSGGNDIVLGGIGSDTITTFGDVRTSKNDADTVIGDNGSATLMSRSGWLTKDESTGEWKITKMEPQIVNAHSTDDYNSESLAEAGFDDFIFTGNGNDVVIGGEGQDIINTQSQSDTDLGDLFKDFEALKNVEVDGLKVMSLNFSYNDSSVERNAELKVNKDEYAGVVAAKNWNNVLLNDGLNPGQNPNPYSNTEFFMNDGTKASGLNMNFLARETWGNATSLQVDRSNGHNQIFPDTENSKIFESYYWAQKQQQIEININNIGSQVGFDVYDVYVYIDGDNERTEDDNYVFEIAGGDIAGNLMDKYYLNDWRGNTFNGEFKEVTSKDYKFVNKALVPNMEMVGNYVVFRNVTAKDFALRIKNISNGDQFPLNMPCVSAVQIVAGEMRKNLNSSSLLSGDYDKDVVIGDNGEVKFTIDIPYGTNDNLAIAINKPYEATSNDHVNVGTVQEQSDYIVTGKDRDIIIGGNGSDAIDSGSGSDTVIGDNAMVSMIDFNPIGLHPSTNLKILDRTSYDTDSYIDNVTADQFKAKIDAGKLIGIKVTNSTNGGNDVIDAGSGNDMVFGMEGDDALIGNKGNDVLYDKDGNNRVKDSAYTSEAAYRADVASIIDKLDENGKAIMDEFIGNDYRKTMFAGATTSGMESGNGGGSSGTSTSYDLSSLQDVSLNLAAGQEVTLVSNNWPGKDNPYWNPDIAIAFNGNATTIPELQVSWVASGVTKTATVPSGQWYYVLSAIPNTPENGLYEIKIKAVAAGSFRVKMANN